MRKCLPLLKIAVPAHVMRSKQRFRTYMVFDAVLFLLFLLLGRAVVRDGEDVALHVYFDVLLVHARKISLHLKGILGLHSNKVCQPVSRRYWKDAPRVSDAPQLLCGTRKYHLER